ncbi:hypothetical protein [Anaerovorax odorimutans]|uniref:hypothetical protein n=1 Tax=Anaerovorax odorimutans TaxID=109327 RepID=UPI0004048248|nr:hypothetical protein [Anaerovorax odorimutans]
MFSQKKSFFRGKLFYVFLIGIFIFGYWINQGSNDLKDAEGIKADSKQPVENVAEKNTKEDYKSDILDNIIGTKKDKKTNVSNVSEGALDNENLMDAEAIEKECKDYYLVKEIDGKIKLFYYDSFGNEKLIRTTNIEFSLLSKEDQLLFKNGIKKDSQEELNELLQDFES